MRIFKMKMTHRFQIKKMNSSKEKQVNILDILDTMVASNVEASVAANGVRDNVIACADDDPHKNAQQGSYNLGEETTGRLPTIQDGSSNDENIGNRRKRSETDLASCCDELYVHITVVEDPNVKEVHEEWVGSYLLESQASSADLLVYKRQTTSKRYLYIRRQS